MSELALFIQKAILEQRKLLAIYLTTSFPRAEWTVPLGQAILQAGADLIELGFPFSDPLADGPTIQHASTIALSAGFKRQQIFTAASVLSKAAPVLIMGYLNSVLSAGNEQFLADCKASGVSGLIVPDLPIDENEELWNNGERDGVPLIPFVSPTTPATRIQQIDAIGAPFVYAVSLAGVTGARSALGPEVVKYVYQVKAQMNSPILVGFGVSSATSAAQLAADADGVIVGSAIIERIQRASSLQDAISSVGTFVAELRGALDHVSQQKVTSC